MAKALVQLLGAILGSHLQLTAASTTALCQARFDE
eukprot:SAG31_NODE_25457_length_461_cov_0.751381_1_plen_34_part_10